MNLELFDNFHETYIEKIAPGAFILHGFALSVDKTILGDLDTIIQASPFRQMMTPNGYIMSVAMTNCGDLGWVTDKAGYRYDPIDPLTNQPWQKMPDSFLHLATSAAEAAGYKNFIPDACLINRYAHAAKLSLHQDKDEKNLRKPIVSVSLGIPAIFLFGGPKRTDKQERYRLIHGDVVVWGSESRLFYHGILPLKENYHSLIGNYRINLTFRKVR